MTENGKFRYIRHMVPEWKYDSPIDLSDNPHNEEAATSPTSTPSERPMSDKQADEMIRAIYQNTEALGLVHDGLSQNTRAMDKLTMRLFDDSDRVSEAAQEGDTD